MIITFSFSLVIGAAVIWADVDTVVARYNVTAYQAGRLESIDVYYLDSLGSGAVPYIARLTEDKDPNVARSAGNILKNRYSPDTDLRGWNYASHAAKPYRTAADPQAMYKAP